MLHSGVRHNIEEKICCSFNFIMTLRKVSLYYVGASVQLHRYFWVKSSRTVWLVKKKKSVHMFTCVSVYTWVWVCVCVCMPLGMCTSSRATSGLFEMQSSTESPVLERSLCFITRAVSVGLPVYIIVYTSLHNHRFWPAVYATWN